MRKVVSGLFLSLDGAAESPDQFINGVMRYVATSTPLADWANATAIAGGRDEFGPGEPSHWYGNRAHDRVHHD